MATLSATTRNVLQELADHDQAVMIAVRSRTAAEWSAWIQIHEQSARTSVRITTFRMLRRTGLIARTREWQELGLIYTEHVLTDAGRAVLEEG